MATENEKKFDGKAVVYAQARPGYPDAFIADLFNANGIAMSSNSVIADIGSGTGKFSELLLKRGCKVYAVEPNSDMRSEAEKKLGIYKAFTSINGTAEHTRLPDKSVDFVTVAQAFHWFDVNIFQAECRRILKDGGRAILVWNAFSTETNNGKAYEDFLRKECKDFKGFGGGVKNEEERISRFFDGVYQVVEYAEELVYDKKMLTKRALSTSYTPKEGAANYQNFIVGISNLFDNNQMDGKMAFKNTTKAYFGGF